MNPLKIEGWPAKNESKHCDCSFEDGGCGCLITTSNDMLERCETVIEKKMAEGYVFVKLPSRDELAIIINNEMKNLDLLKYRPNVNGEPANEWIEYTLADKILTLLEGEKK